MASASGQVNLQALLEAVVLAHDERLAQPAHEPAPMAGHTAPVTGLEDADRRAELEDHHGEGTRELPAAARGAAPSV